jgi:hypothetical protein
MTVVTAVRKVFCVKRGLVKVQEAPEFAKKYLVKRCRTAK